MLDRTAALLAPLLRLLRPVTGRRRYLPALRAAVPVLYPHPATLRVRRPYVLADKRRDEARRQRVRRLELWLAVRGVDVGPRRIHGMEVRA